MVWKLAACDDSMLMDREDIRQSVRVMGQVQKRLVYISSVHAIPVPGDETTISEATRFSPELVEGAYAAAKAKATLAVLDAAQKSLDAVVVHSSGILGSYDGGQNHIVQLVKMCISGKLPAGVTGGYDLVDVRDVAKGCLLAAERGKARKCYILSSRYFTVRELLECVRAVAGGGKKPCLPIGLARTFVPVFEFAARVTHTRPLYTRCVLDTISSDEHFTHDKASAALAGGNGSGRSQARPWSRRPFPVPASSSCPPLR